MALFAVNNVSIRGLAAAVPKRIESNYDYPFETETERNIYIKTTGIEERRIASKNVSASDLCYEAAQKLINDLNWSADEIDLLIIATQSPDYVLPATAPIIQSKLNMRTNTMCFDLSIGCSGFVYGTAIITQLMQRGDFKKGLLLCGDKSSLMLNKQDKATYPLFGDAGSATAFEYSTSANTFYFEVNADGKDYDTIIINDGGARNPGTHPFVSEEIRAVDNNASLRLDGLRVFSFSTSKVPQSINNTLAFANKGLKDVDYFILHQANKLIIETIRKKLKVEDNKFLYSIEKYGNTSSASIPLTFVNNKNTNFKNKSFVLSGFGVGLSWATVYLEISDLRICDLIEVS